MNANYPNRLDFHVLVNECRPLVFAKPPQGAPRCANDDNDVSLTTIYVAHKYFVLPVFRRPGCYDIQIDQQQYRFVVKDLSRLLTPDVFRIFNSQYGRYHAWRGETQFAHTLSDEHLFNADAASRYHIEMYRFVDLPAHPEILSRDVLRGLVRDIQKCDVSLIFELPLARVAEWHKNKKLDNVVRIMAKARQPYALVYLTRYKPDASIQTLISHLRDILRAHYIPAIVYPYTPLSRNILFYDFDIFAIPVEHYLSPRYRENKQIATKQRWAVIRPYSISDGFMADDAIGVDFSSFCYADHISFHLWQHRAQALAYFAQHTNWPAHLRITLRLHRILFSYRILHGGEISTSKQHILKIYHETQGDYEKMREKIFELLP